jgi:hypothetical protein
MERLARLSPLGLPPLGLSPSRQLLSRQFGRLRHLRAPRDCSVIGTAVRSRGLGAKLPSGRHGEDRHMEATAPALSSNRSVGASAAAAVVRVYRSSSRVVMVGTIDAVCEMIDRCIAEEKAGFTGALFDRAA